MNKGVYRVHLNVYISQSTGVSFEGRPGQVTGLPSKLSDHLM